IALLLLPQPASHSSHFPHTSSSPAFVYCARCRRCNAPSARQSSTRATPLAPAVHFIIACSMPQQHAQPPLACTTRLTPHQFTHLFKACNPARAACSMPQQRMTAQRRSSARTQRLIDASSTPSHATHARLTPHQHTPARRLNAHPLDNLINARSTPHQHMQPRLPLNAPSMHATHLDASIHAIPLAINVRPLDDYDPMVCRRAHARSMALLLPYLTTLMLVFRPPRDLIPIPSHIIAHTAHVRASQGRSCS
ncbi:hypothetical protein GGX14DRAFT_652121, partial [Mycena pura]